MNSAVRAYRRSWSAKSPSRFWSSSSPPVMWWMATRPPPASWSRVTSWRATSVGATKPGRCAMSTFSEVVAFSTCAATANPSGLVAP